MERLRHLDRTVMQSMPKDTVALLADKVSDMVEIEDDTVDPTPANVSGIDAEYIRGIAKLESGLLILLHIGKVIDTPEKQ